MVCPQASKFYLLLRLWNKLELIGQSLSTRGLSLFVLMDRVQSFLPPLWLCSPLREGKRTPTGIFLYVRLCTTRMPGAYRDKKKVCVSDPLNQNYREL